MKKALRCLCAALSLMPVAAAAADFSIDSSSFIGLQQTAVPGFDKKYLAPATQYLAIDATKLGVDGLSLHFYGWGYANLGDTISDEDRTNGSLTYFYLSYRIPSANAQLKAGRFFVADGMALQQVDGASFRTDLPLGFTVLAYGGIPSRLDYKHDNTGNWIAGGRVSKRFAGFLELGASTLYEKGLVDIKTTGNDPADITAQYDYRQLVGGDIWFSPFRVMELTGHTYYNTTMSGIAENSYLLTIKPTGMLSLTGDYSEQNPKAYFSTTNLPSLFNPTESDKFRKYGGSLTLIPVKAFEFRADYHHFNRTATGNSDRYGVDLRGTFADNTVRTGLSYHRVEGANVAPIAGVSPATAYHEVRGYALYDAHQFILSCDGIAQFYNEKINGKDTSFEILGSAGYRFTPHLLLSGDISYGQNPELDSEVKGLIKLVYNFTSESKGARK